MQDVVIKVMTDETFRNTLLADPEQTLIEAGFALDSDLLTTVRSADPQALQALAESFMAGSTSVAHQAYKQLCKTPCKTPC